MTIYAENALSADILSTAIFIMGWEKAKIFIDNTEGIEGFLQKDGEIWYSDNFKSYFRKN